MASTAFDFTVKLWDIETTRYFASIGGPHAAVLHTSFSPVGNILVLGAYDIKLLDLETGAHIATFGIPGQVNTLAFSRDGDQLAAATWSGVTPTIELWDTSKWTSLRNQTVQDTSLRAALRIALDKVPGAAITQDGLAILTDFFANEASIFALAGLEFATNLKRLHLGENNIVDLSP